VPYPVYIYAALLPWLFLQSAIAGGGMSLVNNQPLLSKSYLPGSSSRRPTSGRPSSTCSFVAHLRADDRVLHDQERRQFTPSGNIVWLPAPDGIADGRRAGDCIFPVGLTVMFRDLRFIIPFITQLGIWLTAVVYPQTIFIVRDATGGVAIRPAAVAGAQPVCRHHPELPLGHHRRTAADDAARQLDRHVQRPARPRPVLLQARRRRFADIA
jgi:hypothetical protein